ncbi:MAG: GHMP kinase [Methylobacter sp.]|nr:MAG: GHMP kinase [Methylobacter sp.]PPD17849.1 MAG: GHMP kinase [Methylobacter sp.]PPD37458.1 MAG: GHMP kinase [Methylomonas sp.]
MKIHNTKISVLAPARLHMGFIDLSGSLGRDFGSIGVALNEINTRLSVIEGKHLTATGLYAERAKTYAAKLCKELAVPDNLNLIIESAIPEHVGLGSGTQMSLAVGSAINAFYNLGLSIREIARLTDRGLRSGVGIGIFEHGGLIVDGGRGENTITPPVLARNPVPDDWRFILVFDHRGQGLHGKQEINAFKTLPPFPAQTAAQLCYLLLMQGLPALVEEDLKRFGEVITFLQKTVGGYFAPVQGGIFTSAEVAEAMAWLEQQGAVALGQTSWGPTGFCLVEDVDKADTLCEKAKTRFAHHEHLIFITASARNTGGEIYTQ